MIEIESKRKSRKTIERLHPGAVIIDVTSQANDEFIQLSPFYPHGGIPVPFSPGWTSASVEGIWQGLKVFQSHDVSTKSFSITSMTGIKRTTRKHGPCIGHRMGVDGSRLLEYVDARKLIYIPSYMWILENKAQPVVDKLRTISSSHKIVLLDYETNQDVENPFKPLSHASLIKAFIEGNYPTGD